MRWVLRSATYRWLFFHFGLVSLPGGRPIGQTLSLAIMCAEAVRWCYIENDILNGTENFKMELKFMSFSCPNIHLVYT